MSDLKRFIKSTMDFDPVAEAEKQLGVNKLEDGDVGLAMSYHLDKSNLMKRLMDQTHDAHFNMGFDPYCALVSDLGFVQVYEETFQGNSAPELFRVYWHEAGFVLKVESYTWEVGERNVNTANLYYNIKVENSRRDQFYSECVSSGGYVSHVDNGEPHNIWAGHHDVRQALRYTIGLLTQHEVLNKWHEAPHLWFVTYKESHHEPGTFPRKDYSGMTRAKIEKFPSPLREMLLESIK